MKQDQDYATEVVPNERRNNGVPILFVWMGFILVVASMSFGGGLASQMASKDFIMAVVVGNVFLSVFAFLSGYIGSRSGLTFSSLAARVFSKGTWKLAVLFIPLNLIGWYAIEAAIFGNLIADTFELTEFTRRAIMTGAALFFSTSAYLGIRFMGRLSYFLAPFVIIISIYALTTINMSDDLGFGFANTRIDLQTGVGIVLSTWIFSVLLVIPDLTRFVRGPIRAGFIAAFGTFAANSVALGIGGLAAAYTKESDPSLILVSLGFTPLAILLSFAGIWSTNDNNMYSSALSVAKVLDLPRRRVVLMLAFLGAVIAFFNPANIAFMFSFLVFMGASAPPLAGVVLGAFLLTRTTDGERTNFLAAWVAWLGASAITFQMSGPAVIPTGFVLGFVFWFALSRLLPKHAS